MAARRKIVVPPPDPARLAQATELAERAPKPAVAGNVQFGTAGWTDPTLLESGLFYPRGKQTPESRLRFYAEHFGLVEVDATYYALLPPETAERWVTWTPDTFRFDVKAFPALTGHPIDVSRLPADLKAACQTLGHERRVYPDKLSPELRSEIESRFLAFLRPLTEHGRLGALLLQFPPWYTATHANVQRLEALRSTFPEVPLSVEFRHDSWFERGRRSGVLDVLRAQHMSYVCIDEPLIVSELLEVTNPQLSIVRFHGRNREGWTKKGASVHERFDYLYDGSELQAWVGPIRRLQQEAEVVHAIFNNCVRNYAVLNAKDLATLLEETPNREEPRSRQG